MRSPHKRPPAALFSFLALLAASHPAPAAPDISVSFDHENSTALVTVPSQGGSVSLEDLARGLARARGFDDSALEGLLPRHDIPVDGLLSSLAIVALNRAFSPALHFATSPAGDLNITLDDHALFASTARFRQLLLSGISKTLGKRAQPTTYGLTLPPGWLDTPPTTPLVILVHGFNSSADRMAEWDKILRDHGHLTASFAYPNDQPASESAALLASSLREATEKSPGRNFKILSHSMGGILARAVIENPDLNPGSVDQLIMLAPPNHGSRLAHFAFGLEFWELSGLKNNSSPWLREFYLAVEDGLCGAADDLKPDSPFLATLNARPRNPDTRYSILAGHAAPLPPASHLLLRHALLESPGNPRAKQFFGPKLDPILDDMHEISSGDGDGVVSLSRARLDGVPDFATFPFNHDTAVEPSKVKGLPASVLSRLMP